MTTYIGDDGKDILRGTSYDDIFYGGGGNDNIYGRAGNDLAYGGTGNDLIHGDTGNDTLFGEDGSDTLAGGDGDDHLIGGAGNDFIHGGNGVDTAYYSGSVFDYKFSRDGEVFWLSHNGPGGPGTGVDGVDQLVHVERLQFADATIDLTQNNAPITFADAVSLDEDAGTYVSSTSVLANDFDWEGSSLSATPGTFTGSYGTLTMNADGTYSYTLNAAAQALPAGASVQDSFTYTASDGSASSSGSLVFTIAGLNDAPVAAADSATGHENETLTINVLANDSDVDDGAVLTVTAASAPAGSGTASVVGNQVQFDPGSDFDHLAVGVSEDVVVSYTISDEHGATSSSTVTVTVTGTNDGPVANADVAAGHENETLSIPVLANDTDADDSAVLTITAASAPPGKGGVTIAGGELVFDPGTDFDHLAAGASEDVVLSYTIEDEHGASSSSTVTVTVTGTNDGPVANADAAATGENDAVLIDVLANDSDADDGAVLTVTAASAPAGSGTASVVGNQVQFDPGTDFDHLAVGASEDVVVSYTISDEHGATSSSTVTVTVTGTNDGPVANADVAAGHENETLSIPVLANDTDADDGAVLTITAASAPPGKGGVTIAAGELVFDPGTDFDHLAAGASEDVVLSYTIEDEHGDSSSSTVTVTVTGTNDGPVANADAAATGENAAVSIDVLANDTDADDGAALTLVSASVDPGQGNVSIVGGQVQFDPGSDFDYLAAGETADVAISYTIEDEHGASATSTATVTVTGENDAPTIDAGGTTGTGAVAELPNDDPGENVVVHEADGSIAFDDLDLTDTHTASVSPQGGGYLGTLTLDPVNQAGDTVAWHFDVSDADLGALEEGEVVTQTYTVTIDDGNGGTATQDVTITLTGAADKAGPPWYIDNSAVGSNNSGSASNPFTSIAAFNAAQGTPDGPAAGDQVYLLAGLGSYAEADGINLLDGQILTGVPLGILRPTIAPTAGDGVNIGSGNSISGIDIVSGSGDGIADSGGNVASLTVSDVNISTTSGSGIEVDGGGSNLSVTDVTIATGSGYGIYGVGIDGFALADSTVTSGAASSGAVALSDLTGSASFLGNALSGGGDSLSIDSSAGSLSVTIADSASNQAVVGDSGNDGVHIATSGTASLTLSVTGVDFTGAGGDLLNVVAGGSSSQDITVSNSNFHNANAGSFSGGLLFEGGGVGSNISVDYRVEDSSFTGATGSAIGAVYTPDASMIRGSISGNVIGIDDGVAGDQGSSAGGYGIYVSVESVGGAGTAVHTVTIDDNSIQDIAFGAGIALRSSGGGSGNGATLEATVTNNVIDELGDFGLAGLYASVGGSALSGDFSQLGLELSGNTIDASDGDYAISAVYIEQTSSDSHFYFPGYTGSSEGEYLGGTASADLAAFFAGKGNVLTDAPFGAFGGGVDAGIVSGATGDPFTYAGWP